MLNHYAITDFKEIREPNTSLQITSKPPCHLEKKWNFICGTLPRVLHCDAAQQILGQNKFNAIGKK